MTTKQELINARRVLVDHIIMHNVNDETFKILSKLVLELELIIENK